MKNRFIYLAVLAAVFASCEPEFENPVGEGNYSSGDADFSSYVAIGNSLTAGYMDGTVYKSGQMNSYPNMLAQQFALVGGGVFTQPSFEDDVDNVGGLMLEGMPIANGRLVVNTAPLLDGSGNVMYDACGNVRTQGLQPKNSPVSVEVSNLQMMAYNNAGVPGAKSFHLLAPGYGNVAGVAIGQANPYFVRTATSASASVLGDAMSLNPTFFTNWIGANDVLSYATNGGAQADGVTPAADHNTTGNTDPSTYGGNDITNSGVFANVYSTLINTLTSSGAKGVVATIPSVTSIPYFTTVPYNPVSLNAATVGQLNAEYAAYNGGLEYAQSVGLITSAEKVHRRISFMTGQNPVVIVDADLTDLSAYGIPSYRFATAADLIVLPASSFIGTLVNNDPTMVNGVSVPLANKWVLTATEKAKVAAATTAFNNTIVSIANANDLAVADMNSLMNQLINGLRIETGQVYTAYYFGQNPLNLNCGVSPIATEGQVLFSLDGVHPNARGYAVIANAFIGVINAHYNANLPLKYVNDYPGTQIVGSN